jgi:RNA polymerase sigma factor (sigma-70 family)
MSVDTSLSLLQRLSERSTDADWDRLHAIYSPLLQRWLARYGVSGSDLDDLMQDVFQTVFREIPQFRHNGHKGAFRRWLRLMIVNRLKWFWRSHRTHTSANMDPLLASMEDPNSDPNVMWELEHDVHVIKRLLELVESHFTATSWEAFRLQVLQGHRASETASMLGITVNAALIAKSRVLKTLRNEARGMIELE